MAQQQKLPKLDGPVLSIWTTIQKNNAKGVKLDELYKKFNKKYKKKDIDEALTYLNKLYLIKYERDGNSKTVLLKKREILGGLLEDIPCIGCEHLHECHVGGERFSPENCEYLRQWIDKAIKLLEELEL